MIQSSRDSLSSIAFPYHGQKCIIRFELSFCSPCNLSGVVLKTFTHIISSKTQKSFGSYQCSSFKEKETGDKKINFFKSQC